MAVGQVSFKDHKKVSVYQILANFVHFPFLSFLPSFLSFLPFYTQRSLLTLRAGQEDTCSPTGEPHHQPAQQDQSGEVSRPEAGEGRPSAGTAQERPSRTAGEGMYRAVSVMTNPLRASLTNLTEKRGGPYRQGAPGEEVAEGACI